MRSKLCLTGLPILASFLLSGASMRASAQIAVSSSWAGGGRTPSLICNVQGGPNATDPGFGGYFGVSGSTFTCTGDVNYIYNRKDVMGNFYSVVTAMGAYYPMTNGVQGKFVPATFIFSMQKMTDGTQWEGFSAYNYFTGALLYTTGATRDGSPVVLPVMRGSLSIVPSAK